jgi:hypothetical protein
MRKRKFALPLSALIIGYLAAHKNVRDQTARSTRAAIAGLIERARNARRGEDRAA